MEPARPRAALASRWIGFSEDDAEPNRRRREYPAAKPRFSVDALRTTRSTLLTYLRCPGAADEQSHEKINNDRRRNGKEERPNERGPEGGPNNS